jgi:hypothetical protein
MGIREVFEGNETRCCNLKGFSSVDDSIHVRERQSVTGDTDLGTGLHLSRNRGQKPFIHSTLYTTRNEEEAKAVNWGLSVGMYGGIAEFLLDVYRRLKNTQMPRTVPMRRVKYAGRRPTEVHTPDLIMGYRLLAVWTPACPSLV